MEVNPGSDHHHYHVGGGCDDHMNADDDNDTENDNDGDDDDGNDDDDANDDGSQRSWLLILARTSCHESRSLPKTVPGYSNYYFPPSYMHCKALLQHSTLFSPPMLLR